MDGHSLRLMISDRCCELVPCPIENIGSLFQNVYQPTASKHPLKESSCRYSYQNQQKRVMSFQLK